MSLVSGRWGKPQTEEEGFFGSGKAPALGDQADPGEWGAGCMGLREANRAWRPSTRRPHTGFSLSPFPRLRCSFIVPSLNPHPPEADLVGQEPGVEIWSKPIQTHACNDARDMHEPQKDGDFTNESITFPRGHMSKTSADESE